MTHGANGENALGLAGKVVIVTGGGAADDGIGNGRAAAILLARAGAKVLVVDLDGERTSMQPGDFVITPSWTWHDHGNETTEPMVWLDGLDIQIVKLLSASFAEQAPAEVQAVTRPEGDSAARFGNNLVPVDWRPEVKTSPVFNYPYARTREALETLSRNGDPDPYHGHKMRYVNPASVRGVCRMNCSSEKIRLTPNPHPARCARPPLPQCGRVAGTPQPQSPSPALRERGDQARRAWWVRVS